MNWDEFDEIVLQMTMLAMHEGTTLSSIEGADKVKAQFIRRAERKEFPAVRYLVYLNACVVLGQKMDLLHDLMRYGLDTMYPKLTWIDKCSILEFANKSKAPYILKAFNKVVVDLL